MLNWIVCYLSGRHEYGISCHDGAIYLACAHCGFESQSASALLHGNRQFATLGARWTMVGNQ